LRNIWLVQAASRSGPSWRSSRSGDASDSPDHRHHGGIVIVCVRTVLVPPEWRERYLAWIDAGRQIRQ